jgi:WG containing repeat
MRFARVAWRISLSRILSAILVFGVALGDQRTSRGETSPSEPLVVVQNGKYGYIDHQGKIVIRPRFVWGIDFWQGLANVYVCGRKVSVDSNGAFHPRRVALAGQLVPKRIDRKVGFVDAAGQFKIPPTFDEGLPFSEGLAAVEVDNKWGFIDTEGHLAIRPQFAAAYYFREGVATVDSELGTQIVDKSGTAISEGFETIDFVSEGRVPVMRNRKWGFLDLQGKIAIPLVYEEMRPFSGGLALVQKENKWGYIDRNGTVVIPFQFDHAGPFANGLAPAKISNETGFIDRSGKFAFHLKFKYSSGFFGLNSEGLFIADNDVAEYSTDDGLFGIVNSSGKVIWGPSPEAPDHAPLGGWSEDDKTRSCEGVAESVQKTIASFPSN